MLQLTCISVRQFLCQKLSTLGFVVPLARFLLVLRVPPHAWGRFRTFSFNLKWKTPLTKQINTLLIDLMTNRAVTAINSPTSILSPPAPCPQPQIILLGTESRVTISKQWKSSPFHLSCLLRFSGPSCPSCLLKFDQNYEVCSKFLVRHPQTLLTDRTDLCKRD